VRPRKRAIISRISELLNHENYAFRAFVALPLATATLVFLFGIVVLIRERASRISVLFFSLTSCVGIWLFAFSLMYAASEPRLALFWGKAAFLAIPFIPTAVYHFVVSLAHLERRLQTVLRTMWGLSAVFAILILTTDQIVDGLEKYPWGFYPRYAWASGPYLLFFFFGLGAALVHAIQTYRTSDLESERRRMAWVSLSLGVGYVACFDYLPSFGVDVLPVGFLAIAGFVLMMGHTVWRYELTEVTASLAAPRILETIRGSILVTDMNKKIRVTSDAVCALLGYSEDELLGKPLAVVSKELASEPLDAAAGDAFLFRNRELVWATRNGESIDVTVSAVTVADRRGRPVGIVYNAEDISRRKRDEALRESESKYRTLVESMNEGVMLVNSSGIIQFVNQRMADMLGYVPAELAGKAANSFVDQHTHPRDGDSTASRRSVQLRSLRGRDLWVEVSEAPLVDGKGNVIGAIRVHTDITDKRRAEMALRESEARYRLLAEHATDMISRHTPDGRFLYASPASRSLLGYGPEELIGTRPAELIHPDDVTALDSFRSAMLNNASAAAITYRMRRNDATYVWVETTWRPIRDSSNTVTEIIAVSRDITERKRTEQQIEYQTFHDVITGLPNHTVLQDRLKIAVAHAQRLLTRGQQAAVALLYIDLSDALGRGRVDWLLQVVAQRFRDSLRAEDTVARFSTVDFIALLPHLNDPKDAEVVARKLLSSLAVAIEAGEQNVYVTATIGIATFPADGDSFDDLLRNAEIAMYRARTQASPASAE
jgi:PAS domain S-box-containing protein/diguanylate cyclase (GGDEF)-like protein